MSDQPTQQPQGYEPSTMRSLLAGSVGSLAVPVPLWVGSMLYANVLRRERPELWHKMMKEHLGSGLINRYSRHSMPKDTPLLMKYRDPARTGAFGDYVEPRLNIDLGAGKFERTNIPIRKLYQEKKNPYALAHELGHATHSLTPNSIGKRLAKFRNLPKTLGAFTALPMMMGKDENWGLGSAAATSATFAPMVAQELMASAEGAKILGTHGVKGLSRFKSYVGVPTYLAAALAPFGIHYLKKYLGGYRHPRQEDNAMNKESYEQGVMDKLAVGGQLMTEGCHVMDKQAGLMDTIRNLLGMEGETRLGPPGQAPASQIVKTPWGPQKLIPIPVDRISDEPNAQAIIEAYVAPNGKIIRRYDPAKLIPMAKESYEQGVMDKLAEAGLDKEAQTAFLKALLERLRTAGRGVQRAWNKAKYVAPEVEDLYPANQNMPGFLSAGPAPNKNLVSLFEGIRPGVDPFVDLAKQHPYGASAFGGAVAMDAAHDIKDRLFPGAGQPLDKESYDRGFNAVMEKEGFTEGANIVNRLLTDTGLSDSLNLQGRSPAAQGSALEGIAHGIGGAGIGALLSLLMKDKDDSTLGALARGAVPGAILGGGYGALKGYNQGRDIEDFQQQMKTSPGTSLLQLITGNAPVTMNPDSITTLLPPVNGNSPLQKYSSDKEAGVVDALLDILRMKQLRKGIGSLRSSAENMGAAVRDPEMLAGIKDVIRNQDEYGRFSAPGGIIMEGTKDLLSGLRDTLAGGAKSLGAYGGMGAAGAGVGYGAHRLLADEE